MRALVTTNRTRQFSTVSKHLGKRFQWGPSSSPAIHGNLLDDCKLKIISPSQLATCRSPPKGVKALVRDFIHDALYNPIYGYFSQRAVIFTTPEPLNLQEMRTSSEFDEAVARIYDFISETRHTTASMVDTQLWHTPVEIFQVCPPASSLPSCS
jgi:hypothetical protein